MGLKERNCCSVNGIHVLIKEEALDFKVGKANGCG